METLQNNLEQYKQNRIELNALQIQLKELQEKVKKATQKEEAFEQLIDADMQSIGEQKAFLWGFAVSYRKSTALKVFDESLLPEKFFMNVPKRLDADIKKAIQNGEQIAGAELEERQNLQIKF